MKGENLKVGCKYYITCHSLYTRPSHPKLKKGKYILSYISSVTNTFKVEGKSDIFILQEHSFIINGKEV